MKQEESVGAEVTRRKSERTGLGSLPTSAPTSRMNNWHKCLPKSITCINKSVRSNITHPMKSYLLCLAFLSLLIPLQAQESLIRLEVDAREASKNVVHSRLT